MKALQHLSIFFGLNRLLDLTVVTKLLIQKNTKYTINPMINISKSGPPISMQIVAVQHLQHEQQLKGIRRWNKRGYFRGKRSEINIEFSSQARVQQILISFAFSRNLSPFSRVFFTSSKYFQLKLTHLPCTCNNLQCICTSLANWYFPLQTKLSTCWSWNLRTFTDKGIEMFSQNRDVSHLLSRWLIQQI